MKRIPSPTKAACVAALVIVGAFGPAQAQLAPPPRLLPQVKPEPAPAMAPVAAPRPAPMRAAAGGCEEDCLLGPSRPLRFELLAGERESAGFAVTAPGPIKIQVQAQGVPLIVSLRRPDGRTVERQGSGSIVIDDAASAADIARGVLWGVGVRAAQEAPPLAGDGRRAPPRAVAGGTLSVQHPLADAAQVQAVLKRTAAETRQKAAAMPAPAAPAVDARAQLQAAQALHDKQVAQRHASTLGTLRASLPPPAHAQLNQRIELRLQGQTLQQTSMAAPMQAARAETLAQPAMLAAPGATKGPVLKTRPLTAPPATGSTQAAATGNVGAVGSGGGAAVAAPATPPVLAGASTGEGDPGTPVMLSGSAFGDAPGEVRFIVANGRDIAAPVTYWSAAQVVTEVPYADGITVYDGQVYVKRADGSKSALRPFRFLPLYDVAELGLPQNTGDWALAPSIVNIDSNASFSQGRATHTAAMLWGFKGNDKFYLNPQLRNGWVVTGANLVGLHLMRPGHGGAYLVESRPGTTSPYVEVRWWLDAAIGIGGSNGLDYRISVMAKRPKNLPCAANPCPLL